MTSRSSNRPVSALRARMIEDMSVRGFSEKTRSDYIRNVRTRAAFIGRSPDTTTAKDLRRFQFHQTQSGMQPPSINSAPIPGTTTLVEAAQDEAVHNITSEPQKRPSGNTMYAHAPTKNTEIGNEEERRVVPSSDIYSIGLIPT